MKSPLSSSDTLDTLLLNCIKYKVCMKEFSSAISYGKFEFAVFPHSTGNTVNVIITNGDSFYNIINGTYWFSSGYTFNEFKWERGKWDEALDEAIFELRKLVAEARRREDEVARKAREIEDKKRQVEKEKFEALFN